MSFLNKIFGLGKKKNKRTKVSITSLAKDLRGPAQDMTKSFEKALEIARLLEDRKGEARALGSIGNSLYISGDRQRANEFFDHALTIWRDITGGTYKWHLEDVMGQEYQVNLGEVTKGAITLCEVAFLIAKNNKDMLEAALISNILSMLFYEQGLLSNALHFADTAVDIYEKIGSSKNAQSTHKLISLINRQLE